MSWYFFAALTVLTVGGGLGVVSTRNVVHAALFLLVSLLGVAGLYVLLLSEFLALVQIFIYGGAIIIVLLFAIMLTRSREYPNISDNKQWPLAALAAIGFFGLLTASFMANDADFETRNRVGFTVLARALFNDWALPFEVASLVLLIALVGAIVIAQTERQGQQ
ncbi:MAG: NADH-quinone oxidoreductase subunit J [SAR202 cluster bacterium]|nr:NADH-quinone oxidoreductase subunit J [SAR202 cluster bacterium]